jgi:transcriptional regulator with XRE-family HTH domain
MQSISKILKKILIDKNMTQTEVAKKLGTSKGNFNNQLNRDNYRLDDVIKIADILGYETNLVLIDKDTNEKITIK